MPPIGTGSINPLLSMGGTPPKIRAHSGKSIVNREPSFLHSPPQIFALMLFARFLDDRQTQPVPALLVVRGSRTRSIVARPFHKFRFVVFLRENARDNTKQLKPRSDRTPLRQENE